MLFLSTTRHRTPFYRTRTIIKENLVSVFFVFYTFRLLHYDILSDSEKAMHAEAEI